MSRKQRRASRSVWEDQSTDLNPQAPSVVRAVRAEKWKRRALTTIAWGVIPVCALVSLGFVSANVAPKPGLDMATASLLTNSSEGKSVAYAAVQEWLEAAPSPLPGGVLVSWDGYTVQEPPKANTDNGEQQIMYRFENHAFTAARGAQQFTITVQVAVDDTAGATVTATPSISPIANVKVPGTIVPWFGYDSTSASQDVQKAVDAWADAFTSGDPDILLRAVQDKNTSHAYLPLSGVADVDEVVIIAAGYKPVEGEKVTNPDQILVRAEIRVWWDGQEPVDENGNDREAPEPITYDLLIADAGTASPYVVAWGGPGSGPALTPYMNALNGVEVTVPTQTDGPTPTPSETTSGEGE